MKKNRLLHLFLLIFATIKLNAQTTFVDGIKYEINTSSKECGIINDSDGRFDRPASYSGTIIIPSSITYEGVEYTVSYVDRYAFYNSKVTFLWLPKTIKRIGEDAFALCEQLEKIILPEDLTSIPKYCFHECSELKTIDLPSSLNKIEEGAFLRCYKLETLNIPSGVVSIGNFAFEYCKVMTKVILPDNLQYLGSLVFRNCPMLDSVSIDNNNNFISYDKLLTSKDTTILYFCSRLIEGEYKLPKQVKNISTAAFHGCSKITNFIFNENLDSIQNGAFSFCTSIDSIVIPKGVVYLGYSAFENCSSLKKVSLPNTLKEIDGCCFYYTPISEITIPNSVEILGDKAFYTCDYLYKANVRGLVPAKRGSHLFPLRRNMEIHIINGLKELYEADDNWNQYAYFIDDLELIKADTIIIEKEEYYCGVGEKMVASAIVLPDSADLQSPIWSSSDESIVYIDKNGSFIGLKEGVANIIATANDGSNLFAISTVHVGNSSDIRDISLNKKSKQVFDLNGISRKFLHKGMNIIIQEDGKTKKVIIK